MDLWDPMVNKDVYLSAETLGFFIKLLIFLTLKEGYHKSPTANCLTTDSYFAKHLWDWGSEEYTCGNPISEHESGDTTLFQRWQALCIGTHSICQWEISLAIISLPVKGHILEPTVCTILH